MTTIPPAGDPGSTLKRLREAKGLTQAALAQKLGKSRTAVAAWEYGRKMSTSSRAAVARLLGVSVDTLGAPWNPHGARPQHRRRARAEADYLERLRALGDDQSAPRVAPLDDADPTDQESASPAGKGAAAMIDIPDPDLFQKIIGFWRAMESDARVALVREAHTLSAPPAAERTAARGKAQG